MTGTPIHVFSQSAVKLNAARRVFAAPDYDLIAVDPDIPEIQAATSVEIARYQATEAAKLLGVPVAREDHSTWFDALGGMPGPFAADFEAAVGIDGLLDLLEGRPHTGYLEWGLVYATSDGATTEFVHRVGMTMSRDLRGEHVKEFGRSLVLDGRTRTLAEYPPDEVDEEYLTNFRRLRAHLEGGAA